MAKLPESLFIGRVVLKDIRNLVRLHLSDGRFLPQKGSFSCSERCCQEHEKHLPGTAEARVCGARAPVGASWVPPGLRAEWVFFVDY